MSQVYKKDFLSAPISVLDSGTAIDGAEFNSVKVPVKGKGPLGAIAVQFNPAAGASGLSIDFEFKVSLDNGSTWTTGLGADAYIRVQTDTDRNAVSGIVVHMENVALHGITHIKLNRVIVEAGAGNCSAIQATVSMNNILRG